MPGRGRPKLNPEVRLRIIQLRASIPSLPMTIDAILDRLAVEEIEVSRSFVGTVVKEWEARPEEDKWLEMPFEWRRPGRALIPWEASRLVMDCQVAYDFRTTGPTAQWINWILRQERDFISNADPRWVVTDKPSYDPAQPPPPLWVDPFTNRWACWCWRVQLAAPDFAPCFVLDVARIYSGIEQLTDLLQGAPAMDLSWLDGYLKHHKRPFDASMIFIPDVPNEQVKRFESAPEGLDPLASLGLNISLYAVSRQVYRWRQNLQQEEDPNAD